MEQSILRVNYMTADVKTGKDQAGYILACQLGRKIPEERYTSCYEGSNRKKVWTWLLRCKLNTQG